MLGILKIEVEDDGLKNRWSSFSSSIISDDDDDDDDDADDEGVGH